MSPVEMCGIFSSSTIRSAWVPFPAPGNPIKTIFKSLPSRFDSSAHGGWMRPLHAASRTGFAQRAPGRVLRVRLLDEALVVPFDQLAFDVFHRLQGDPDHDQEGGSPDLHRLGKV